MQTIKLCNYKGRSDIADRSSFRVGMRWVCRCVDCRELFLGIKNDFACQQCKDKPEINNGDEG